MAMVRCCYRGVVVLFLSGMHFQKLSIRNDFSAHPPESFRRIHVDPRFGCTRAYTEEVFMRPMRLHSHAKMTKACHSWQFATRCYLLMLHLSHVDLWVHGVANLR